MKEIGYDRPLFIQPFDHRGSFTRKFFDFSGQPRLEPNLDQHSPIVAAKTLIYRGLLRAIELGVDKEQVGVLVDAQYGAHILDDARRRGIPTACPTEMSGQSVFHFEYGARWTDHIRYVQPNMIKVLVRYHPEDDALNNREQLVRLKQISDYVHATDDHYFMFELLVPATTDEEKAADDYDVAMRPQRMIESIREIQDYGVEPDIWKIEGLDRAEDARAVAAQTRSGDHRAKVGNILLGRGSNAEKVHEWLRVAAPIDGFIGFTVGRTNFSEPIKECMKAPTPDNANIAVEAIAQNYKGCVDVWLDAAS
ncbi:MAG: DUF2090 domain-containing protein [Acidobacteriota bacterium]